MEQKYKMKRSSFSMDEMLQEFITFANENFGVNVTVSESDAPDSFEKIYGRSIYKRQNNL